MSIRDRTLALAGIFQAAELVRQVARHGVVEDEAYKQSLYSLLQQDAESTEAVYGGLQGVKMGLTALLGRVPPKNNAPRRDLEVMGYVIGAIVLERKLIKQPAMLNVLSDGIQTARWLTEHYDLTHPEIVSHFARLYSNTISTFDYRIQVHGESRFLQNAANADRVRALLLAAIRSAVLWRQRGGNRWQFLFSRGKILHMAQQLLHEV